MKFLLCLLAGLLSWQAALFTYGTVMCANVRQPLTIRDTCPDLADNYSKFVQTTLGAVLGLLAGSATQKSAFFFGRPRRLFGFTASSTASTAFSRKVGSGEGEGSGAGEGFAFAFGAGPR